MKRSSAVALGFLLLALAAGGLRQAQTIRMLPGEQVRFGVQHAVAWDPATRQLRRTGADPYVWLTLPDPGPVRSVTFEFAGRPADGPTRFYVYQSSAYLPDIELDDSHVVLGCVTPSADRYSIRWNLDDSQVVRLDLPDDLMSPVELRRVTVVSAFHGPWLASLMWLLLGAAALAGGGPRLAAMLRHRPWLEPAMLLGLVALKLGLASDLHLAVLPEARHDDLLFVAQAQSLREGNWLGAFDELTLAKGPVYPLFLAAVGWSGWPLLRVETLVHALAVILLVRALRPLLPSPAARLLLGALLLFDPHTLSGAAVGRMLRSGLQPALTLLTVAGFIGLATRIRGPGAAAFAWSLLAGISLALFWHCREEGLWLLPSSALLLAVAVVAAWRAGALGRGRRLLIAILPLGLFLASGEALRAVNRQAYGSAITVDVRDGSFPAAYGALLRVTPDHFAPRVPVSQATRRRAYEASPAFAELRPYLEGEIGRRWADISQGAEPDASATGEIQGGWFQWALRESAAAAGHYRTAADANAYWARVARELNAAADAGRLPAGPRRSGFVPPWNQARLAPLLRGLGRACAVAATWSDFSVQFPPRAVPAATRTAVEAITHERVATSLSPATRRTAARLTLADLYRWAGWPVAVLTLVSVAAALLRARRETPARAAVLVALGGGVLALLLIVALVDATSFHAAHAMYLAPASPLLLALWVLGPAWARPDPAARGGTRACAAADFPVASRPSP
ncbi:MAG: hypothetical protein JSR48_02855 [Verrucomicrobia bacterium]|nr:hypothetical protein [Verrucomicrobiota bacterium]